MTGYTVDIHRALQYGQAEARVCVKLFLTTLGQVWLKHTLKGDQAGSLHYIELGLDWIFPDI